MDKLMCAFICKEDRTDWVCARRWNTSFCSRVWAYASITRWRPANQHQHCSLRVMRIWRFREYLRSWWENSDACHHVRLEIELRFFRHRFEDSSSSRSGTISKKPLKTRVDLRQFEKKLWNSENILIGVTYDCSRGIGEHLSQIWAQSVWRFVSFEVIHKQTNRQTDKQTNRQTHIHFYRYRFDRSRHHILLDAPQGSF